MYTETLIMVSQDMDKPMAEDIPMGLLVSRMGEVIQLIRRKSSIGIRIMKDQVRIMVLLTDLKRNDTIV